MPKPDRTKEKTPAASTAEVLDAKTPHTNERTKPMNSIAHPTTAPALSFSLEGFQLRVIMINGDPWFFAMDVCEMLGIKNPTMALRALDDDEITLSSSAITLSSTEGNKAGKGNPNVNLISEGGLYTLILRSRDAVNPGSMPHRVRRWVTGEVLPSIRKTGGYSEKKLVPWDRGIGRVESIAMKLERAKDPFTRAMLVGAAKLALDAVGLPMPDVKLLRPLAVDGGAQLTLDMEGGAA